MSDERRTVSRFKRLVDDATRARQARKALDKIFLASALTDRGSLEERRNRSPAQGHQHQALPMPKRKCRPRWTMPKAAARQGSTK